MAVMREACEPRESGDREGQVTRDTAPGSKKNQMTTSEFLLVRF